MPIVYIPSFNPEESLLISRPREDCGVVGELSRRWEDPITPKGRFYVHFL